MMNLIMHIFWLVLTYGQLEDKCINDFTINKILVFFFTWNNWNGFYVAMILFSYRSHKISKCGTNNSNTPVFPSCVTLVFLSHFDVVCDLLLNKYIHISTWIVSNKYIFHWLRVNWRFSNHLVYHQIYIRVIWYYQLSW